MGDLGVKSELSGATGIILQDRIEMFIAAVNKIRAERNESKDIIYM